MKLSQLKDMFIIDNEIKGNSKKTIAQYKRVLVYFIDFTADIDVDLLTIDIIKSYQKNLLERQFIGNSFYSGKDGQRLSRTTVNTYMTHLRTFVIYLYDNQYIDANLFDKITIVKKPKIIKEILSDYEIEKVLMSFSNCEMSVRNQCIFLSMVDAGLRLSEICNLDVPDVIFNGNMIKINEGKGFKDRYVPMSLSLKKSLYKYITMYRVPDSIDNKALFLSKDKKRITEKAVTMVIVRLRKKMNFDKMNPHRLRHTFATNYIINGGDMFNLQLILGHEDIQTVRKYVHLARYYLQSSYTNISVCDRLSKNNSKIKI